MLKKDHQHMEDERIELSSERCVLWLKATLGMTFDFKCVSFLPIYPLNLQKVNDWWPTNSYISQSLSFSKRSWTFFKCCPLSTLSGWQLAERLLLLKRIWLNFWILETLEGIQEGRDREKWRKGGSGRRRERVGHWARYRKRNRPTGTGTECRMKGKSS